MVYAVCRHIFRPDSFGSFYKKVKCVNFYSCQEMLPLFNGETSAQTKNVFSGVMYFKYVLTFFNQVVQTLRSIFSSRIVLLGKLGHL